MRRLNNQKYTELAIGVAAGTTLLLASLANFLSHNSYPYWRPEVGLVALCGLIISVLGALFYAGQRQWGRSILEGVLAAIFVDLNSDAGWLIYAAGIGVAAFTAWRRISLLGPMAVLGSIVLLSTAAGIGVRSSWTKIAYAKESKPATPDAAKPAVLHLILDEHIGIEGLPNNAGGQELGRKLKQFYTGAGFALYGGAYSEHLHTINAIPNILNYGKRLSSNASTNGVKVGQTEHLQGLFNTGYRTIIFQSDFADYCSDASHDECITYDSYALAPTLNVPLSIDDRFEIVSAKFVSLSIMAKSLFNASNLIAHHARTAGLPIKWWINVKSRSKTSTIGAIAAIDILRDRIQLAKPGEAYFAHFLLPHYPYTVDSSCRYLPRRKWEKRRSSAPISARQSSYYAQVECTTRKVAQLLKAFEHSPAGSVIFCRGRHSQSSSCTGRIGRLPGGAALKPEVAKSLSSVEAGWRAEL